MTTRQALLQALAEAGEKRPELRLGQFVCVATLKASTTQDPWGLTDRQLLEGLRKLME